MRKYVLRRILQSIPIILAITFIVFVLINAAPGDPLARLEDPSITKEDLMNKLEKMGMNDPLIVRYGRWLKNLVLKGHLGYSMDSARRPVTEMILERLPATLFLSVGSLLFSFIFAIPIGIISATKQYSKFDYGVTIIAFLGISMPSFYLALLMLYSFSLKIPIFPSGGFYSPDGNNGFFMLLYRSILPMFCLGFGGLASLTRYMRSSMLEVIREDYIRTARAKGLAEKVVVYKHAFRNALIPVITILGLSLPGLMSGSVLIERIFSWPGMGKMYVQAIFSRNYTLIMGYMFIYAVLVYLGNLIADISYALADPRIRYD
ncbi:hypothetical protein BBF96_03825 [Anoxybacter fermentans]|uniref:ABC transmembrane type-1 domain-containing protein n=1 Tax=Anoxybacter fermentans TaxID=1323375 RepID=A0A3S9SWH4_9FIRM|nr:ABC transporter permease [Anoxybacter fermentans]AZR72590.1 hypothetical protein BBF96_03825 [Anoxybacter fermentans]